MSGSLTLTQIAHANRPTLVQWAVDHGIELLDEEPRASIQDKLRATLGLEEAKPVKPARVLPVINEVPNLTPAQRNKRLEMLKVRIATGPDGDSGDVIVGINGQKWLLKKDMDLEIPRYVYQVLAGAVQTIRDSKGGIQAKVPLYNISVLGLVGEV